MNYLNIGVGIQTPYHLYSILSYMRIKESKENIIFIHDKYKDRFENFGEILKASKCSIYTYSNINEVKVCVRKIKNKEINLISVNFPKYSFKMINFNINLIKVGDGLSSYSSLKSMYFNLIRSNRKNSFPLILIKYFGEKILSMLIKNKEFYLFNSKDLSINNNYVTAFNKVLFDANFNREPLIKNNSLVFIGQPLVKLEIMEEKTYFNYLMIAQKYAKSNGLEFFYKPHPLEDTNKLNNINILEKEDIIEKICSIEKKIKVVCSFYSTALITLPAMFDIKAVRLTPYIKDLYFSGKQNKLLSKVKVIK